jgi:hypothetical protein
MGADVPLAAIQAMARTSRHQPDIDVLAPSDGLDAPQKLRNYYENFPKIETLSIMNLEIDRRADLVYERGRYELNAGGVIDRGSHLTLWRLQSDGRWKTSRDI